MSDQLLDTPSRHPFSIIGLADKAWHTIRENTFQAAWAPIAGLAESAVVSVFNRINEGCLCISTPTKTYTFPPTLAHDKKHAHCDLQSELRVLSDVFWIRLCTMGDLGFAEAFMYGEVECDDLISTFLIFVRNRDRLQNLDSKLSFLFSLPQKLTSIRFLNTISNSRANISAHYDISNKMFSSFLSEDMTYSCAIFKDLDGDLKADAHKKDIYVNGSDALQKKLNGIAKAKNERLNLTDGRTERPDTFFNECIIKFDIDENEDELKAAQIRKLEHIIARARIQPGQRILEIGSGWGSLALLIAERIPHTIIDTLTLSIAQMEVVEERLRAASIAKGGEGDDDISKRVRVHLMDYRAMPTEWEGTFDRVISVEMIEAVGREYLEEYWHTVDWALKKDSGIGVVQSITIPEARYERYVNEIDFIRKWVSLFPGGFLPTLTLLISSLTKGSHGRLVVDSVSNIGPHYARTLREWRRRFLANFESGILPALREEYPIVMSSSAPGNEKEAEVFKRKWIYYYCYCEIGFTMRLLGDHIITFTREGNEAFSYDAFD